MELQEQSRPEAAATPATGARVCVLVLGMHRSGTSAVTRALSLMGAQLPRNLLGAQAGNEAGHWEPSELLAAHNDFLESLDSSWSDWRPLSIGRLDAVGRQRYLRRVGGIVEREYADAPLIVVKDPRISRFADLFGEALARLGIETRAVLCLRAPDAVAASLATRDGMDPALGRLLWLRHTLDAELASRGLPRVVTLYDDLLADPVAESHCLLDQLDVRGLDADDDAVRDFIDPGLNHHEPSPDPQGFFATAYATLTGLRHVGDTAEVRAQIDRLRAVFDELSSTILTVEDAARETVLARRNAELRQAIDALAASEKMAAQRLEENSALLRDLDSHASDLMSERAKQEEIAGALHEVRAELDAREVERTVLIERLETHEQRGRLVEALRHELEREHDARLQLEQTIAKREAEAQRLAAEAAQLQTDLSATRFERNEAHAGMQAMRSSTSWRLTSPLRLVGHMARGNWRGIAVGLGTRLNRLPKPLQPAVARLRSLMRRAETGLVYSRDNFAAVADIVAHRNRATATGFLTQAAPALVPIDVSIVTHNDGRWLDAFGDSLLALDYPHELVHLVFVDNGSTDDTPARVSALAKRLVAAGFRVTETRQGNKGFGGGHNAAIARGTADFVLVTNVDLEFAPDALRTAVATALTDDPLAAAWELRQVPYEHPKFYDPVTGATNWNAHACVLLRRSVLATVGGYDEHLFMYGEDVELSYRLRRAGHILRYVPRARVTHHSYADIAAIKPRQFAGSTLANLYLRLKYGHWRDMLASIPMGLGLTVSRHLPGELKRVAAGNLAKLAALAPAAIASRRRSAAHFPFRRWDYEMVRDGGDIRMPTASPAEAPLVSIVTRTVAGREHLLRQAVLSVFNQTYGAIEHVIVQDGGDSVGEMLQDAPTREGYSLRFLGLRKLGRSAAGNAGLRAARGRWCLFLDDDDLLFGDHVETLVAAAVAEQASAAYALSWEVPTQPRPGAADGYLELNHYVPPVLRQEFSAEVLRHHNFASIQAVLFERSLFEQRGGFEEDMDALEDWVLWNKYAVGNHFAYVQRTTSLYRVPGDPAAAAARAEVLTAAYPAAVARIALNARRLADRS